METTRPVRVMHPDVYDTLEFMAQANGGIGAGRDFEDLDSAIFYSSEKGSEELCPRCIWGFAIQADGADDAWESTGPVMRELERLGVYRGENDLAVVKIAGTVPYATDVRVEFDPWAAELGIVRGDAKDFPEYGEDGRTITITTN